MFKHKAIIAILIAIVGLATAAVTLHMDDDRPFTFTWKGYDDAWKKVDSLEEKGLPRSARDVVEVILEHAHTDKNGPQQVKAVTHVAKYILETEDAGFTEVNTMYLHEISISDAPVKNILSSMLATLYSQYYFEEGVLMQNRTSLQENESDDPLTWDKKVLLQKIREQTDASVADRELLKSIPAKEYALILENTNDFSFTARPTLYDLLGHRALELYTSVHNMQAGPDSDLMHAPVLFADNKTFTGYAFTFGNSAQDAYIRMMQDLTRAHINDAQADAGIFLLLERLEFMRENFVGEDADEKYLQAMHQGEKTYRQDTSSTWFTFKIAEYYNDLSSAFDRLHTDAHKWDKKTAISYCDSAIAAFPRSTGGKNAQALKEGILAQSVSAQVEEVNIPEKPFRVSLQYANTSKVYFKVVQVTNAELTELDAESGSERVVKVNKLTSMRSWTQNIPDDGDHNQHVVEVKSDGLTPGRYFLVSSTDPQFSIKENETGITRFDVSNIGYISTDRYAVDATANGKIYYVVDRTKGAPIENAQVYVMTSKWVGKKYKNVILHTLQTDANGKFVIPTPENSEYLTYTFKIGMGSDTAWSEGGDYIYNYKQMPPKETISTLFFTDRSIYRPGQTVYYKGIVYTTSADKKSKTVVSGHATHVVFYDVNAQEIGSADLVTNAYGSFHGSFTAPTGVLTGPMRIQNEESSIYFSVEEYKRPTFRVEMQALEGTYIFNDTVFAKGSAHTYSEAPVAGATVQYRVVRNAFVPYYYNYYYKSFPSYGKGTDIASGTVIADADGNFTIPFIALPGSDKNGIQEYTYTVTADVTDISGETRSASQSVSIGNRSLQIYAEVGEYLSADTNAMIQLHTENLNGVAVPASGTLILYALQGPDHILRNRRWQEPDAFVMSKAEFATYFPNDLYAHENDKTSWSTSGVAASFTWNTADTNMLRIPTKVMQEGTYKLVFNTRDKNGEDVHAEYIVEIKKESTISTAPQVLLFGLEKEIYHPGESAIVQIGSSVPELNVLFALSKESDKRTYERFTIPRENNKKAIATSVDMEVPVSENDRGGFYVSACAFYLNDMYTDNHFVQVPWDNKKLKVALETHRDKLKPGTEETWKVTISGPEGEKVAAELLASMYDASLDAFTSHMWSDVPWPGASGSVYLMGNGQGAANTYYYNYYHPGYGYHYPEYYELNWFDLVYYGRYGYWGGNRGLVLEEVAVISGKENKKNKNADKAQDGDGMDENRFRLDSTVMSPGQTAENKPAASEIATRSNLNETAFFYPDLQTDADGNIVFAFTIPEALTTWNFMAFAHDKEMRSAQILSSVVTQKELMIQPNMPRFLRAGDTIDVRAKISNLTENALDGMAYLELYNALNMERVDMSFALKNNTASFHTDAKGNAAVEWHIIVPEGFEAIQYKVKASAGDFTDGEENAIPVLTNRILVTEALPLWVRGQKDAHFQFTHLLQSDAEKGISNRQLSLEYTSNPAWYAVQALPYMMEYPYECAEQLFNRYYSNAIAYHIAQSDPEIERIFEQWKKDGNALTSNLEKNEDLKALMLQETPWVLQAQDESARKKRVALLFDKNTMNNSLRSAMQKLSAMQLPDGGFPWFSGYQGDRYITQYIVTGAAHLKELGIGASEYPAMNRMLDNAILFCDEKMKEDYKMLEKNKVDKKTYVPGNITIQYLYARSYFTEYTLDLKYKEAYDYYLGRIKAEWKKYGLYEQGMIALIMQRTGNTSTASDIVKSLKEFSQRSDEMGMWWKNNVAGYYWYQAPVETQALMIEVFDEVAHDAKAVEDLQVWLLRQKQTGDWKTTRATAEACYALLSRGQKLLSDKSLALITLGDMAVEPEASEAGTGYFRMNWMGSDVHASMGNVSVTPPSQNVLSYGALYWQYFQDLDKVKHSGNAIQVQKEIYLTKNTANGPELLAINEKTPLHIGDLVTVRLVITSDRKLEYVHLKDMRASLFEPVNVMSGYKWQGGLGYYEATGDAATNFFIAYMDKGTYVFEYPLRVTQSGNCSNGLASIQCMYAPEFVSYSEGRRVKVMKDEK